MRLFDKLRRKARWNVFNMFELNEFAECSNCGCELPRDKYDEYGMPQWCSKCGARIEDTEYADD